MQKTRPAHTRPVKLKLKCCALICRHTVLGNNTRTANFSKNDFFIYKDARHHSISLS